MDSRGHAGAAFRCVRFHQGRGNGPRPLHLQNDSGSSWRENLGRTSSARRHAISFHTDPCTSGGKLWGVSASFIWWTMRRRSEKLQASHRSEEHTSELQSLMRISYAVFCLKKKKERQKLTSEDMQTSNQQQR